MTTPSFTLRKPLLVYAAVGAACANVGFRRALFSARSEQDLQAVMDEFTRQLGVQLRADTGDIDLLNDFVAPRVVSLPQRLPLEPSGEVSARPTRSSEAPGEITTTFETDCENFTRSVCPRWPCDRA